jgi:hypothetical protein
MVTISRWKLVREHVNVEVPEGCIVCPTCKGSGEIRVRWGEPSMFTNEYRVCASCFGEGYVNEAVWKRWVEMKRDILQGKKEVKE